VNFIYENANLECFCWAVEKAFTIEPEIQPILQILLYRREKIKGKLGPIILFSIALAPGWKNTVGYLRVYSGSGSA